MCVFLSSQALFDPAALRPVCSRAQHVVDDVFIYSLLSFVSSFSGYSGFSRCLYHLLFWVRLVWFGASEAGGRGCEGFFLAADWRV